MARRNGGLRPAIYVVAMTDKAPPAPLDPLEPPASPPTTFLGQPVVLGPAHHVQSITPIRTVPSQPIKKRHTKDWWKRRPADD